MDTKALSPWALGLAVGLGIGIGLSVGHEAGGDNIWVRLPASAATAAATARIVFGVSVLIRRLSRKS